jgi:hypothetical protein
MPMPVPTAEQDRVHPPRDDPRWRESYYFSFFDETLGIGGFSSIGKRPAKGHTGFINVIWGPEIPTLVASEFGQMDQHDDNHSVAGLEYRAEGEYGPWALSFDGRLNDGGSATECDHDALGSVGRLPAPKVDVGFELSFVPTYPPYLYEEREEWRDLFDGHVDEVGTVEGELRIGSEHHAVDGRGAKDHSWGVRDWFKPDAWRWLDVVSADAAELALWRASFGGDWIGDGAVYADGKTEALAEYEEQVTTTERPDKPIPSQIELDAGSASQRLHLSGEIVRTVPIMFSKDDNGSRLTSWNDRALVRCAVDGGGTAWANVEFESLLRGEG